MSIVVSDTFHRFFLHIFSPFFTGSSNRVVVYVLEHLESSGAKIMSVPIVRQLCKKQKQRSVNFKEFFTPQQCLFFVVASLLP